MGFLRGQLSVSGLLKGIGQSCLPKKSTFSYVDDNFLLRVPAAQQAESYIAKLGTAGINANLIVSQAHNEQEAEQEIISNNIKGIIFEPTLPLKKEQYIDVLNNLIPELANTPNGARVRSAKFPSLSALIQTNFYSYPGVFKFRVR